MRSIKKNFIGSIKGIVLAGYRFPMTIICLVAATLTIFREIAINISPPLLLEKLIYIFLVGAVIGMTTEFLVERMQSWWSKRFLVYGIALLVLIGYAIILMPAPEMSDEITIRSLVAAFGLFCISLWLPAYKSEVDFNKVALVHFKAYFTSLLYSGIIFLGTMAIIGAVDILLFNVHGDTYAYCTTIVWVIFSPLYYLSLLPKFHSLSEEDQLRTEHLSSYPKLLEILISYIAIPLISAYTLVLIAYFVKILYKLKWPSGQVAPMVLIYSIAGLAIFILSSLLENHLVVWYRKLFPKILVGVVLMQLIAVGIRLNSYGVTQSRYYVTLFGVFFLIIGLLLSFKVIKKNEYIILLATVFTFVSIIPPVDAFTVSRVSQIHRLEKILRDETILVGNTLLRKEDASETTKMETTSILYYLERSSSLKYISWLPKDFNVYKDLELTFGFEPTYRDDRSTQEQNFEIGLTTDQPITVSGYDILMNGSSQRYRYGDEKETSTIDFEVEGKAYELRMKRNSEYEVTITILDSKGNELIQTGVNEFVKELVGSSTDHKQALTPEELSFEVTQDKHKLKIIFQNISYIGEGGYEPGADYSLYVLFKE